jgi:hypothetical protein
MQTAIQRMKVLLAWRLNAEGVFMHNCNDTDEQMTECADCREESDALNETLRITTRLIDAAAPPDSYWPGYHARLRDKLTQTRGSHVVTKASANEPSWITRFFRASVPVPVPVGLALILVFALSLLYVNRAPEQTAQLQIVHVPVEVPVVQEKIVTHVVYRKKQTATRRSKRTITPSQNDSTLARTHNPLSLIGFKPTEEIKLTVIKGRSANEK